MPNQFGKIQLTSGKQSQDDVGGTGLSGVVIGNESGLTVTVEMQGTGGKWTLYPGTVDFFAVPANRQWNGNLLLTPTADLSNTSSWPGSYCYVDTYGVGERPSGTYPLSLNRANNLGNQVTIVSGSSTSVQNDNNAAGTTVVEATVLGSPSSNVEIFNDGSGWFGRWVNPSFTKIFQWFSAGTTALQLAATGLLTEILGNLKVDGTTELVGNTTIDGTLGVTGTTAMGNAIITGTATMGTSAPTTSSVSGNETVGGTLAVTGNTSVSNLTASGNIIEANAEALQWKDSTGVARTAMQVDGSNNLQLFGITGNDKIQFLKHDGTLELLLDLVNGCLNVDGPSTTINGGQSGTAVHYMPFQGTSLKMVIIKENNFKTGASNQDYTLPTAFTNGAMFITGNCVTWNFVSGGAAQNCNVVTAIGTAAFQTSVTPYTYGNLAPDVSFDTVRHTANAGSAHTGWIIIIGV